MPAGGIVWPEPGGIAGLDLARRTGWAYGPKLANTPLFGFIDLPNIGGEGERLNALDTALDNLFEKYQPSAVVIEAPLSVFAGHTSQAAMQQQYGLRAIALCAASRWSVAKHEIDAREVRRDLLGASHFPKGTIKREVLRACRRRGWAVTDHNEADACLLWQWFVGRLRGVAPVPGRLWAEAMVQ